MTHNLEARYAATHAVELTSIRVWAADNAYSSHCAGSLRNASRWKKTALDVLPR